MSEPLAPHARDAVGDKISACLLCGGATRPWRHLGRARIVYCERCQLGQLDPLPTEEELRELYSSGTYFAGGGDRGYGDYLAQRESLERTFERKLRMLLRYRPVESLLDLGCGPGILLGVARRLGIPSVLGVDPNPWAVGEARAQGLDAIQGDISAVSEGQRFDAVTMLDVLEHVTTPRELLGCVRDRLNPRGALLLMTPNLHSWLERVSGPRWVSYKVPEHVCYHTPASLQVLLREAGFRVRRMRPAGQYVSLGFLLDRISRVVPPVAGLASAIGRSGAARAVIFVPNGSLDVIATRE